MGARSISAGQRRFPVAGRLKGVAMAFHDRKEAGQQLASLLLRYQSERPLVLALPRGGVPVACEVAQALGAQLDMLIVRKIGAPQLPEYAIGAIVEGGTVHVDPGAFAETGTDEEEFAFLAEKEATELARRVRLYRGDRPFPAVRGRTVIVVDDGIATGCTALAAVRAVHELRPRRVVLATPVVAAQTVPVLRGEVDELVYVEAPETFVAVGLWYERFEQTTDGEVLWLLNRAHCLLAESEVASRERGDPVVDPPADPPGEMEREVEIAVGERSILANLTVPPDARGVVLFARGSGSSRFSPRNRYVARRLREEGLATLLLDLLTPEEEMEDEVSSRLRFDIGFLAARVARATRFLLEDELTRELRVGLLGSSVGAAAALVAAAELPGAVAAVVSHSGRPDLAGSSILSRVCAPTLLVVGRRDTVVLDLNRAAFEQLLAEKQLAVVPGATHLFEEPGTLDVVARLAADWFGRFLGQPQDVVRAETMSLDPVRG